MIVLRLENKPDCSGDADERLFLDFVLGADIRSTYEDVELFRNYIFHLLGGYKFNGARSSYHADLVVRHMERHVSGLRRSERSHFIKIEFLICRGTYFDIANFSSEDGATLTRGLKELF
jgi:hypothetical protein